MGTQNGTLVNGTHDSNRRSPGGLNLTQTQMTHEKYTSYKCTDDIIDGEFELRQILAACMNSRVFPPRSPPLNMHKSTNRHVYIYIYTVSTQRRFQASAVLAACVLGLGLEELRSKRASAGGKRETTTTSQGTMWTTHPIQAKGSKRRKKKQLVLKKEITLPSKRCVRAKHCAIFFLKGPHGCLALGEAWGLNPRPEKKTRWGGFAVLAEGVAALFCTCFKQAVALMYSSTSSMNQSAVALPDLSPSPSSLGPQIGARSLRTALWVPRQRAAALPGTPR